MSSDEGRDSDESESGQAPKKRPRHNEAPSIQDSRDVDEAVDLCDTDWDEDDWRAVRNAAKKLRRAEEKLTKRQAKSPIKAGQGTSVQQEPQPLINDAPPIDVFNLPLLAGISKAQTSGPAPTSSAQLAVDRLQLRQASAVCSKDLDKTAQCREARTGPGINLLPSLVPGALFNAPRSTDDSPNDPRAQSSLSLSHGHRPEGIQPACDTQAQECASASKARLPLSRSTGASFALQSLQVSTPEIPSEPFQIKYYQTTQNRTRSLQSRPLDTTGSNSGQLYYAVRSGKAPDVYHQWYGKGQAQDQVRDFKSAVYDLFDDDMHASWFVNHKSANCKDWCCNGAVHHPVHHAPARVELNDEQKYVIKVVESGRNVFYTGSAGSGKSTVLHSIVKNRIDAGKRVEKLAPTGLAALNIGGQTYFKFAGWNADSRKRSIHVLEAMARRKKPWRAFNEVDVIVTDEHSMIDAHQTERLDRSLRAARQRPVCKCTTAKHLVSCNVLEWEERGYGNKNARSIHDPNLPFGGVQFIVTGMLTETPALLTDDKR